MEITGKIARFVAETEFRKDPVESDRYGEARAAGLPWRRARRQQGRGRQNLR